MTVDKWALNGGIYLGWEIGRQGKQEEFSEEPPDHLAGVWSQGTQQNEYVGDRHIAMFGPNGSGKSWRVLVPNLCRLVDWSMVVVDPKGALAAHTAVHRAQLDAAGQPTRKVVIIDPFKVIEENYPRLAERFPFLRSTGLNPISALNPDAPDGEAVDDAKAMAEAIIKVPPKGESHWAQSAQALVRGLILALKVLENSEPAAGSADVVFEVGGLKLVIKEKRATLGHVRQLLGANPKDLADFNKTVCSILGERYPFIGESLNRFTDFSPENRELFSILSTAITQTEWLSSPRVRDDVAAGWFDFGLLKREPVTVYLVIPPRYLATHATWLRLMITAIMLPLLRSVENSPVPVLFALDEYAALGHMEVIENNMALMREYGVKLFLALQDLTQLKDVHPDRWESFIGNAGVRLLFAPQDHTTQDYFSNLGGKGVWTYRVSSQSTSTTTQSGENKNIDSGTGLNVSKSTWGENIGVSSGTSTSTSMNWNIHKNIVPRFAPEHLGSMLRGQGVLFIAETRRGAANVVRRSMFPDPRSVEVLQDKSQGSDVWNDTVRAIRQARKWIA